jgi:vitamin B12 transporter
MCLHITAQSTGSLCVQNLPLVEISTPRLNWSQNGKRILTFDSLQMQACQFQNLGDLLGSNSGIFIKQYGLNSLATTAFRGGNASQTAFLWNGFNINHPMLGQANASHLPVFLFDEILVEHGGSSTLNGSGAISGSLHFTSKSNFDSILKVNLILGGGSFSTAKIGTSVKYGVRNFYSTTRFYREQADNDFVYLTDSLKKLRRTHNQHLANHVMQDLGWRLNNKNQVIASIWHSNSNRLLPKAMGSFQESKAVQYDENTRAMIGWKNSGTNYQLHFRTAWLRDVLNYTDSMLPVFSKSETNASITELETQWHASSRLDVLFGFQFQHQIVNTNNYNASKQVSRGSFMSGAQWHTLNNNVLFSATIRQEQNTCIYVPPTGQLAMEVKPCAQLSVKVNASKVYRVPTLNDWYWNPGGNPNLKPEEGYATDGTAQWQAAVGAFQLDILGSLFYKSINNWILWLPATNGITSPKNVLQVLSRGAETQTSVRYQRKSTYIKLQTQTSYVLSTVEKSELREDASIGQQLIYTPRYQVNGNLIIGAKKWFVLYNHQYIGYRFTSSDNLNWLMPYHIGNVKLNYTCQYKQTLLTFFSSINNCWNANYTVIQNQPMPLRYYEAGIRIQQHYKLKQKQI